MMGHKFQCVKKLLNFYFKCAFYISGEGVPEENRGGDRKTEQFAAKRLSVQLNHSKPLLSFKKYTQIISISGIEHM